MRIRTRRNRLYNADNPENDTFGTVNFSLDTTKVANLVESIIEHKEIIEQSEELKHLNYNLQKVLEDL